MRAWLTAILFACAVAAGLAGCQSSAPRGRTVDAVPQLDAVAAGAAGLSARQVSEASALYATKCAKCHKFYEPAQYLQTDWDEWMRKMSRKSKLKSTQEELLSRYLSAYRESIGKQRTLQPP